LDSPTFEKKPPAKKFPGFLKNRHFGEKPQDKKMKTFFHASWQGYDKCWHTVPASFLSAQGAYSSLYLFLPQTGWADISVVEVGR
jgi:hypothetical protein